MAVAVEVKKLERHRRISPKTVNYNARGTHMDYKNTSLWKNSLNNDDKYCV